MRNERPRHASFFSGVGGTDIGLERAGWQTVSFAEIDPYASAVLAERWPGIPNVGDMALAPTLRVGPARAAETGSSRP
jgi:site-specific DNA-cytosine methylase